MDYKTKYIKYKKKYLELKSQIGGVVLPNNKGTNHDVRKKTQGFLDGKSLASLKIVNKDNLKNDYYLLSVLLLNLFNFKF